jgi:hypothetical protein
MDVIEISFVEETTLSLVIKNNLIYSPMVNDNNYY